LSTMAEGNSPVWHPFTQHAIAGPAIPVVAADGARLITEDGRTIIDAISSWWVNTHGHSHPRIAAAIAEQAARLEHVIFAGFTHEPAERLARKVLDRAGGRLEHAFFSDSGSTAVEVAIKMAVGCWYHRGAPRCKVIALEDGYHGDSFGTMACGERGVFTEPYWPMLFEVEHLPFPAAGREQDTVDAFERILREDKDSVAALILEPLLLGAGGMRMYPPWVLKALADVCHAHNVFLIADEVLTGFGRTGSFFACDQADVRPDIMCLSKGLTGGFLPMGVTLATREIFEAYYSPERARMFFHSTSYTGNPIACAAALASMDIWETEPVMERIRAISDHHQRRRPEFEAKAQLREVRQTGTVIAFEINVPQGGYLSDLGPTLYRFFIDRGVLVRPLGNVIYILPPYCITPAELDTIYDAIADALDLVGH